MTPSLKIILEKIKILFFFPDFPRLQGWMGGSDQIWKIPDFFFLIEPFPNPPPKKKLYKFGHFSAPESEK